MIRFAYQRRAQEKLELNRAERQLQAITGSILIAGFIAYPGDIDREPTRATVDLRRARVRAALQYAGILAELLP